MKFTKLARIARKRILRIGRLVRLLLDQVWQRVIRRFGGADRHIVRQVRLFYRRLAPRLHHAQRILRWLLHVMRRTVTRWYRYVHHHVARRPHAHLQQRWRWYGRWHTTKYHHHVHVSVFAVQIFIVGVMVMSLYRTTQALSDVIDTWDFANISDFTTDDGIEVVNNSARLKAQNYTSDQYTAALFHFDEQNGTAAGDSSSYLNNGVMTDASFTTGNLNGALQLNGTTGQVAVADSAALSLLQSHSLEAWTKLNAPLTPGSATQRNAIMDKGDYQLYYDNETGRVTYELANDAAQTWSLAAGNDTNGSWDINGKRSVTALTKAGTNVYAALGNELGDAEVWRWNGTVWTQIGGGATSMNNSWESLTYENAYSLTNDGTNVYVGLGTTAGDAEVWKWDGSTWTKLGGDAIKASWALSTYEVVTALDYFGGTLYAGLGTGANEAEVWSYSSSTDTWTKIGGDALNSSWGANYEQVTSLTNDGSNLYVGLGASAGDGEVWRFNVNGASWTKLGGDGVGWDATIELVRSLHYVGGSLYAGLGSSANDADVWRYTSGTWTQIGGDALNSSWGANYEQVMSMTNDGNDIIVGLGVDDGDGEVWRYNAGGNSWTKIGGDGVGGSWASAAADYVFALLYSDGVLFAGTYDANGSGWMYSYESGSWTARGGNYINKSWGYYGIAAVQVMQHVGNYMYAGLGNTAGTAQVWRFDGTTWTLVGGQGVNGSWPPNAYEQVLSMASYRGKLYVGLGISANDAEVWEWNGTTWTQIGGDSLKSGWGANFEEVASLASHGGYLYAGLGSSAGDAEVWRYNGITDTWDRIGGDGVNAGWNTGFERVASLAVYNGRLIAGLGASANDAEIWEWSGSSWLKTGGDGLNGGWNLNYEQIDSLIPYGSKLYAGLGTSTDDAEVWEWNGTTWTKIGGDDLNGGWAGGISERVRTMAVYNGDLYAGLGNTAGDAEVWRYSGNSWTKIGGNNVNGGWANAIEEVESFSVYKGKLYVGNGLSANADAMVYSWGNNGFLQSNTSSFDDNWHHIAATYDGVTMKLFIDGQQNASTDIALSMPDTNRSLLIGRGYAGREAGRPGAAFAGKIDEVRISTIPRTSFTSAPYSAHPQTIRPTDAVRRSGIWRWDSFGANETADGSIITYRLSDDAGESWKYWNGSGWVLSANTTHANAAAEVQTHIATFPVTFEGLTWQAVLDGNGVQRPTLNQVVIESTSDITEPSAAGVALSAQRTNGGASLSQNGWTNGSSPYFSWTAATDSESGIKGYCVYVGTDSTADPISTKGLLGNTPIDAGNICQYVVSGTSLDMGTPGVLNTPLTTSNNAYYVSLRAIDNAGNVSDQKRQFHFRFDNGSPTNPGFITSPSGFINTKAVTLTWPTNGGSAPSDSASGIAGLQYRIGPSGTWYGDVHSGTGDANDVLTNDGSYTTEEEPDYADLEEGINTIYFRTWDNAGNVTTSYVTGALKINTAGAPSEPQNLHATPAVNTTNSFAFDWDRPDSFIGEGAAITYCYTFNATPSAESCTFTNAGITSLGAGPYATQPGANTIYVIARDESGSVNYDSYASTTFSANTPAPGMPLNLDIVDVSIKATENWRLALTWDPPGYTGAGVSSYKVFRSTDGTNFTSVGASSSTTYIDANLDQREYYYKVRACDSTNNCGALGNDVHEMPTGRFTTPAAMVAEPAVSNVTTKKATIRWSTDRASDSKIAIGTTSGRYSPSEISSSDQVSAHQVDLDNLAAGTTYYYVAKWTDEDGNTGSSQEYSFTTAPPPSLKEISTLKVGLVNTTIQFTSKNATRVAIMYGKSEGFGGLKTINTSAAESTYAVDLTGLDDGAKYFYQLVSYDSEDNAYAGSVFSFATLPRPRISSLTFQPVAGEPTSTQKVTWATNVPSTSTITYGKVGTAGADMTDSRLVTEHELTVTDLEDDSQYFLLAQSRDADGNLAVSDRQIFHTALDTRPPKISDITVESSIRGSGAEARGQVVVSWRTDEPGTSQVAYAEGSDVVVFNNRTSSDDALSFEHIVIVSDLPTSKVYSIQPVSKDKGGNEGMGEVQSAIIGRASDNVLTLVLNTLKNVFGF